MQFQDVFLAVYFGLLGVLCIYGFHRYYMAWLYYRNKHVIPTPQSIYEKLPAVTVQLPIYNEQYVVERLIEAVSRIRYPRELLEIQVLDDSTDDTREIAQRAVERYRAQGLDIHYIHRTDRSGFKAGALEAGLAKAKGEFVAVFDADFVPAVDFLERTVHFFTDSKIGMVQVRWEHLNRRFSLLTRAQAALLDGHFIMESCARYRSGRFFNFNGTAGIWRRAAIEQAGGWQHDTLTEDLDLSYRAQICGWRFVFLADATAPAEIPVEMNSFKSQQHRWAKGSIQTARKLLPTILRSTLPFKVKLEAFFHLTNNFAYPFMVLLCLLMPLSLVVRADYGSLWLVDVPVFLLATVSIGYFYAAAQKETGLGFMERVGFVPLVLAVGIGLCINNAKAVVEAMLGKESSFVRTPKYNVVDKTDTWKRKTNYHRRFDWVPYVEFALGIWFTLAVAYALATSSWLAFPFLLLFQFGFLYMSLLSFFQTRGSLFLTPRG
jgi:cellulose synthase/poly-beta-1,6-N-acetylglucosamine synthase-like glycosyltransferase